MTSNGPRLPVGLAMSAGRAGGRVGGVARPTPNRKRRVASLGSANQGVQGPSILGGTGSSRQKTVHFAEMSTETTVNLDTLKYAAGSLDQPSDEQQAPNLEKSSASQHASNSTMMPALPGSSSRHSNEGKQSISTQAGATQKKNPAEHLPPPPSISFSKSVTHFGSINPVLKPGLQVAKSMNKPKPRPSKSRRGDADGAKKRTKGEIDAPIDFSKTTFKDLMKGRRRWEVSEAALQRREELKAYRVESARRKKLGLPPLPKPPPLVKKAPPPPKRVERDDDLTTPQAPQVQLDEEGNMVLNVDSIINKPKEEHLMADTPVQDEDQRRINSSSFKVAKRHQRWTPNDTKLFYLALRQVGQNFTALAYYFPTRHRSELRNKFRREERAQPKLVALALAPCNALPLDMSKFHNTKLVRQIKAIEEHVKTTKTQLPKTLEEAIATDHAPFMVESETEDEPETQEQGNTQSSSEEQAETCKSPSAAVIDKVAVDEVREMLKDKIKAKNNTGGLEESNDEMQQAENSKKEIGENQDDDDDDDDDLDDDDDDDDEEDDDEDDDDKPSRFSLRRRANSMDSDDE